MDLEFATPRDKTRIFDVAPQHDTFGVNGARLIAPGHADQSIIPRRMALLGNGQMPPLARNVVDEQAVQLIREWIKAGPSANDPDK
jgi:hypothetical protein